MRFTVHDAAGKVLATVDDILIALPLQRAIDAAEEVRRVSDGALLATKGRTRNGESFYQAIWNLHREPDGWQR